MPAYTYVLHTCLHTHASTYMPAHICVHACLLPAHTCVHTHACTHMRAHTCVQAHACTHMSWTRTCPAHTCPARTCPARTCPTHTCPAHMPYMHICSIQTPHTCPTDIPCTHMPCPTVFFVFCLPSVTLRGSMAQITNGAALPTRCRCHLPRQKERVVIQNRTHAVVTKKTAVLPLSGDTQAQANAGRWAGLSGD